MYDNVDNAGGDDDDDHNVADNGVEDDYVEDDEVQEDDVEDDHVQGGVGMRMIMRKMKRRTKRCGPWCWEGGRWWWDYIVEEEDDKDDNAGVAEDEVEVDDAEDDESEGEEYGDVGGCDGEEEGDDDVEDDVEEEDRGGPIPGTHTLREPAQSKCIKGHCTRAILWRNLQVECRGPKPRRRLCASPRKWNAWRFHKSHFMRKFTGCRGPAVDQDADTHTHTHTLDKNWSFIGSVGNWIPCKQN